MTEAWSAFYFSNYLDWDTRHVNEKVILDIIAPEVSKWNKK